MPLVRTRRRLAHLVALTLAASTGCGEPPETPAIEGAGLPTSVVEARAERQHDEVGVAWPEGQPAGTQILFGDLHVHSTYSIDAFLGSLPMMQGDGLHPVADACDFARYCSDLDFWSINDHAQTLDAESWAATKESIRQCNALSEDEENPDLVSFLGWEWTQVGDTPETHYGHKNVIFRETAEDRVPTRVVAASQKGVNADLFSTPGFLLRTAAWPLYDLPNRQHYTDFLRHLTRLAAVPPCEEGVDVRELPLDCQDNAETPSQLFRKLDEWGFDALVIPHGNTWGLYTPPGTSWDKQLTAAQHDPARQRLIEVYSGHGNAEEYRDDRAVTFDTAGAPVCPEPTAGYLPCCWRAGELIEARCEDSQSEECQQRVRAARQNYLALGTAGHLAVSGDRVEDWLECGQCTDCFLPTYNHRPASSAQAALALSNFDDGASAPRRFRFGFIGSSDNHSARPGTGYKEYERRRMTEAFGPNTEAWRERIYDHRGKASNESLTREEVHVGSPFFNVMEWERAASFFLTGGLVAVHSTGRSRDAIWEALQRREVYGTSGPRILLWFDLLNGTDDHELPMGSETRMHDMPHFRVRAAGARIQRPGCPAHTSDGLDAERLETLCRGECYNPGDERLAIHRIEVVRIRPQVTAEEPLGELIEDPWKTFHCPPAPEGCVVEFEDPEFPASGREAIYYVRVIQDPTEAINADSLRCRRDADGNCLEPAPCFSDLRTPLSDDCLGMTEERAWSSPIFVSHSERR